MNRSFLAAVAITAALVATGCRTTEVAQRPPNPGSHHVSWVASSLLPGRTVIQFQSWTRDWQNWFVSRAVYHTRHDALHGSRPLSCEGRKRRYSEVRHDGGSYYTWKGHDDAYAASGNEDGDRWPVFYDPETGRFHTETWNEDQGRWVVKDDGWIQEGWPRLMADACPGITEEILADGGWINEKQTHPTIYEMLEQDPTAPLTLPGMSPSRRTGLGAVAGNTFNWCFESPSKPVLPAHCFSEGKEAPAGSDATSQLLPESPDVAMGYRQRLALADALKAAHGHVLEDRLGRSYVLALHPEGDEFWSIDAAGQVLDVGYLAWNAAENRLELDWETLPATMDYHLRPGEALPVVNTGRRHPLFAMTDWLTGRDADVTLPYFGRQALFRFGEDGSLVARATGDRSIPGSWTVSRGSLVLTLEGVADKAAYAWQPLARHLGDHAGWGAG